MRSALFLLLLASLGRSDETFPKLPPEATKETVCMFFGSPFGPNHMWDTWLFHNDGTYYLFWLDGRPQWNAHAMAVSTDCVHWQHKGLIYRMKEGVTWLGTGHTWKSPDFAKSGKFINNYSEWHKKKNAQDIHFAESTDLLNWKKVDEKYRFVQDTRWYTEKGRWDCIDALPRPGGGLYGFWTATPDPEKVPGAKFGFGESLDGITWKALKPPVVKGLPESTHVEVGGVHQGGRYVLYHVKPRVHLSEQIDTRSLRTSAEELQPLYGPALLSPFLPQSPRWTHDELPSYRRCDSLCPLETCHHRR